MPSIPYLTPVARAALDFFLDAGRFTGASTQVVKLGTSHITTTFDLERVNDRAVGLEHTLYAFAMRNLANRE